MSGRAGYGSTTLRAGGVFVLVWAAATLAGQLPLPWPLAGVLAAAAAWLLVRTPSRPAAPVEPARGPAEAGALQPPEGIAPACGTEPPARRDADLTPAPGTVAAVPPGDNESLAYTVSHDLRAPIRVIEGFTRIVREDYGHLLDRVGNDHLERVLGAAGRMNHMIDSLMTLARLSSQPLSRQAVDLSRLAAQVIDELRAQAPQRQCEALIEPGIVVQGDPTSLQTVLENLLGNAWKYTARRDTATITFGRTEQEGRTVYFVRDNGAGFDMRFADRLFAPFQRLHSASEFQGTGVGLASVQRIVRRHGGDVHAESAVNRGATFYFTLG